VHNMQELALSLPPPAGGASRHQGQFLCLCISLSTRFSLSLPTSAPLVSPPAPCSPPASSHFSLTPAACASEVEYEGRFLSLMEPGWRQSRGRPVHGPGGRRKAGTQAEGGGDEQQRAAPVCVCEHWRMAPALDEHVSIHFP
jgi:hypothetical protein